MKSQIFLFLLLIIVAVSIGQEKQALTVAWIHSDEARRVTAMPNYTWLQDNTALILNPQKPDSEQTFEKLFPATGRLIPILDHKTALKNLTAFLAAETPKKLPWPDAINALGQCCAFIFRDDLFLLDLKTAQFFRLTETETDEKAPGFSPDGKKLAFVRANDLYVYDIESRTEKRLTFDGSETLLNGTLSWIYWEEIFGRHDNAYWWSEDSKAIAFLQTDESPVSLMYFVDFKPWVPRLMQQRYPKAGGNNPIVRTGVIEVENTQITWIDLDPKEYEYLVRAKWLPDSRRLSVQTLNRAQTELKLYFADRASGQPTLVLTETDPGWVNIHDDLYFLANGKHFIWASERDGYAHLYRFKMTGELVNQITQGEWAIRSADGGVAWLRQAVVAIDQAKGWIYFTALEKSALERHLYRISLDGTGLKRLSWADGSHGIDFSPNARYYLDRFSGIDTLPSLSLYNSDGKRSQVIAESKSQILEKFAPIQYPELFTIPASDGFPLPAELIKPTDFSRAKKYPLIIYVYGGPSAPSVVNAWRSSIYFDQILMQNGYLVARIDNRTAIGISKMLENQLLRLMSGEHERRDLLAAVQWFKSQAYVDPERVGIWGWSGGGSFTLNAMTHSSEFKAGIAIAAVTDWHYYDSKWAEFAMKRPEDNPEGYEKTSFVKSAKDLHGRLLLVHGTYDDNVHPQNAWSFIDALVQAGKRFEMMFYPMRQHGISDRPAKIHLYETMLEFWQKNL